MLGVQLDEVLVEPMGSSCGRTYFFHDSNILVWNKDEKMPICTISGLYWKSITGTSQHVRTWWSNGMTLTSFRSALPSMPAQRPLNGNMHSIFCRGGQRARRTERPVPETLELPAEG